MKDLENNSFSIPEYKDLFKELYSDFLNMLVKERYDQKFTTKALAKMLNCSIGKISDFENRKKDYDYLMLNEYAKILRFNLVMRLDKMTYSEIMSI